MWNFLQKNSEVLGISANELKLASMQGSLSENTARQIYKEFDEPDRLSPMVLDSLISQLFAQLCRHAKSIARACQVGCGTQMNSFISISEQL